MRPLLLTLILTLFIAACGSSTPSQPAATLDPLAAQGRQVFQSNCATCHSTEAGTTIVGPSLAGIATRASGRIEGVDTHQYLQQSILTPSAYIVEGFTDLMPQDFGRKLSGEELDAVIAYLLTLQE